MLCKCHLDERFIVVATEALCLHEQVFYAENVASFYMQYFKNVIRKLAVTFLVVFKRNSYL